ncbi:sulfatase-like hydrolase/transferase [Sporosarcina aquimarina]|uniref:Sulfatase-like hydrolase/transferase n=1 Tax=Sporosarcina aquimarina TaxID=114975 RepID=A0ABU4FVG9_9BACL|nr:sulfatase-like hydrolase/transferase [Sporosarcina aquimarina]MDW0108710.1 sulfatase-like hydrolase/transferase [Sporosarcina aquimarina]
MKEHHANCDCGCRGKQPNILFLMVDQDRFPPVYETQAIQEWRRKNLVAQHLLMKHGMTFLNHYVASTACAPSRTSLYTGHYPSLHGVTQTPGAAKGSYDADQFWLDPNTVPTTGDYFRAAGYDTFYHGKWHASEEDIVIPGTKDALPSYNTITGSPNQKNEGIYRESNRLDAFGFSDWIGPDPHGADPRNSGSSAGFGTSGRDEVYAAETVQLIEALDKTSHCGKTTPWFIQCSFVNPHDIALYGIFSSLIPSYNFEVDPTLPYIPLAPTTKEVLTSKPSVQESYRLTYPKGLQPIINNNFYRQLYYSLMKKVDDELMKVLTALQQSSFLDNTIIVFTSDHGEQLGAHGGLYQKWYNIYEESIHVPFIISTPHLVNEAKQSKTLTSHVDILPTLLGLANINATEIQHKLATDHTDARPLVGRNLAPLLHGDDTFFRADEPLYFMTEDNVFKGLHQTNPITGKPYDAVIEPSSIEAVITKLKTGTNCQPEIWKLARYYDNPQFWSNPGVSDTTFVENDGCVEETVKTEPVPDQFELYNLTQDPLETKNMADPGCCSPETEAIQRTLEKMLEGQRCQKRLVPKFGSH